SGRIDHYQEDPDDPDSPLHIKWYSYFFNSPPDHPAQHTEGVERWDGELFNPHEPVTWDAKQLLDSIHVFTEDLDAPERTNAYLIEDPAQNYAMFVFRHDDDNPRGAGTPS